MGNQTLSPYHCRKYVKFNSEPSIARKINGWISYL